MSNIVDLLTDTFVWIDDFLRQRPDLAHWRRSRNTVVEFTDSEVLTLGVLPSLLGVATRKDAYAIIAANYRACFPRLCGYKQWLRRLNALSHILGPMIAAVGAVPAGASPLYVIDSKALPVVKTQRIASALLLRDQGASFGKTSSGWYFGFKLHLLLHHASALVVNAMLTPGNVDDRYGLTMCSILEHGAYLLADEGYNGHEYFDALSEEYGITRVMPSDKTGVTAPGQKRRFRFSLISALRQSIETTFSQLCRGFVDRILARSWQGLWNRTQTLLLTYNLRTAGIISA